MCIRNRVREFRRQVPARIVFPCVLHYHFCVIFFSSTKKSVLHAFVFILCRSVRITNQNSFCSDKNFFRIKLFIFSRPSLSRMYGKKKEELKSDSTSLFFIIFSHSLLYPFRSCCLKTTYSRQTLLFRFPFSEST